MKEAHSSQGPRLAIVFWETYLGCAPSLINAARALDENGYAVDILIRSDSDRFAPPPNFGPNIRIIRVDGGDGATAPRGKSHVDRDGTAGQHSRIPACIRRRIGRALSWCRDRMGKLRPASLFARSRFARRAAEIARRNNYFCLIGVDTHGLIAAHHIGEEIHTSVIYWSLEITFDTDFADRQALKRPSVVNRIIGPLISSWVRHCLRWKQREKECHRKSLALVIQDRERAEVLCRENQVENGPVLLVPNSPRGFPSTATGASFLHDRLNLSECDRIILHAGSVCEGMRSHHLAQAAASWPDSWKLVFHSHTELTRHDEFPLSLSQMGNGRVVLSDTPVDYDDLDELYQSAHVGVVIYDNSLGPNFQLLAGASGKLAHSLRCGIPVVSVGNPAIGRVLSRWKCGIDVLSPSHVEAAIHTISSNYETFCRNALLCYREAYEFDRHFAPVLKLIETRAAAHSYSEPG